MRTALDGTERGHDDSRQCIRRHTDYVTMSSSSERTRGRRGRKKTWAAF